VGPHGSGPRDIPRLYSEDPDATRAFFRDTLKLPSVDAGRGWLIFALPRAELGIHPAEGEQPKEMYLMCDNVDQVANYRPPTPN
jgi:hypothetical protein